eukprot:2373669-Rhodomonas_salina.2
MGWDYDGMDAMIGWEEDDDREGAQWISGASRQAKRQRRGARPGQAARRRRRATGAEEEMRAPSSFWTSGWSR